MGIIPIRDDSTCVFGAIDIDVYADIDHVQIVAMLAKLGYPLVVCRSKSGGAHVYLFAAEPVPAAKMQAKLRDIAARLGHGTAEIFPKQIKIGGDRDLGSWINMPYFDHAETVRPALGANGDPLPAERFLDYAEATKATGEWFDEPLPAIPASAPRRAAPASTPRTKGGGARKPSFKLPDVIGEGQRDIILTSYAGTLRRSGATSQEILTSLRGVNEQRCKPPKSDGDLQRIAQSIGRKEPGEEPQDGLVQKIAKTILTTDHFARDTGGRLYHFEDGVYRPTGTRFVECATKHFCEAQGPAMWTPELAARVETWIAVDARELWERPPLDVLNVRNGFAQRGNQEAGSAFP